MKIQKILVPTDFSTYADIAIDHALDLASGLGARVTLFHTYELPIAGDASAYMTGEVIRSIEAAAQGTLDSAKLGVLRRWRGAPEAIGAVLAVGPPALRIVEEAERQGTDLIVMGTHGRTGIRHLLVGSVAERVVRTAPCPVLTIRGAIGANVHVSAP